MKDIYRKALGLIDLTSLNATDTHTSITALAHKVNGFKGSFPDYPLPASVCVFPNFAPTLKRELTAEDVHITVVAGCFPASQSPLDVKVEEASRAVEDGADEVDIVLALNAFLDGKADVAAEEIETIGEVIRAVNPDVHLKVILETGALRDAALIRDASMLAMEAGADFIKTSTGKMQPAATPEAAEVMCRAIADYHRASGRMVGFKPAGGISTADDAVRYYEITGGILGEEWLQKRWFRYGASRMANNLLSALEGREINYF